MDTESDIQNLCTKSCCADGDDDRKIKCSKCKRSVHYACTNLPIYQLRLFYTKNYRGFICVSCVEVPADFKKMFENQGESMIDTYKREIKACESIIMVQKDNEEKFISGIKKLKEERKIAHQEKDLVSLFQKRFDELEKKIDGTQTSVEEMKKSGEVFKLNNEHATKESFAGIVKSTQKTMFPEFRKILRDEKLKEIDEERQHDLRSSNIMVFGRNENTEISDDQFVRELVKDVGADDSNVKFITRIGEKKRRKDKTNKSSSRHKP